MLPILKMKARQDGQVVEMKKPESDQPVDSLEIAMMDLADAIQAKDRKAAAEAFRAAMQICELEPHSEYSEEE